MIYLQIKNWEEYQHYKDRNPPWIKLHKKILDDYDFSCLQDASKLHLILIWLLASQLDNKIPNDPAWVRKKIGVSDHVSLKELIDKGFLIVVQDASVSLAKCSPETETYREETETKTDKKKINKKEVFVLPDWIDKQQWEAWLEIRLSKKAKNTTYALNLAVSELAKLELEGHVPSDVLNQSIMRAYTGLFPIKKPLGVHNEQSNNKTNQLDTSLAALYRAGTEYGAKQRAASSESSGQDTGDNQSAESGVE